MPYFRYQAVDEDGRPVKGEMRAADETELHRLLLEQELYLIRAKVVTKKRKGRPLKTRELSEFSRGLGTMIQAGIPLVRVLTILVEEEGIRPEARGVYQQVLDQVCCGYALSEAMERQSGMFPELMCSMFRAAEASGSLGQTALLLAEHYSKAYKMDARTKNAFIYPKLLAVLLVVMTGFLVGFVLPQFEPLFSLMEELPLPTRILYKAADILTRRWQFAAAGAAGIWLGSRAIVRIPAVRKGLDWVLLHMPVLGKQEKTVCTARFARAISSLYSAGIPIVDGLQIARKTTGNSYVDDQFDKVIFLVRSGCRVSDSLDTVDGLLKKLPASVRVGEETGNLDVMLTSLADSLEYDAEQAMNRMVTCLEPLMIVIMAIVVGSIMAAVMLPIYESYQAIEQAGF